MARIELIGSGERCDFSVLGVYYTLLELHAFSWPAALTTRLDKSHS